MINWFRSQKIKTITNNVNEYIKIVPCLSEHQLDKITKLQGHV